MRNGNTPVFSMRSYTPTPRPRRLPSANRLVPETMPPQTSESPVSAPFSRNQSTDGTKPTLQPSRSANESGTATP